MATFDRFDVVSLPFPAADRPVRERRPALVVSQPAHEKATGLIWVVMITAGENRARPHDVPLSDPRFAGLSIPSVIRPTKIATIEATQAKRIGRVTAEDQHAVQSALRAILG
ncbi:MAG TPA: type II toxin-antitoxin system PemK/MazF family toxin [Reyranella sp.]|nr:type II toxin-antitoxin system PemK/MazF family toxin [Reyranella sp.]